MVQPYIEIKNLVKSFNGNVVLKNVNLTVNKGEYVVILGPTGAGKTTLLKLIAGLIKPDTGDIIKDNQSLNAIPPEKRNVAYLPQTSDYSLFPYMTVWENTVFSPKMKGIKTIEDIRTTSDEILDMVNLRTRYDAFPYELSGGMKQRVALARAIAADADVFLLDEPLRALDARLRIRLRTEIKNLVSDLKKTTFHVTHDFEEALAIADRVLIINKGEFVQFDTPQVIYEQPSTSFSAYFFGDTNLLPGRMIRDSEEGTLIKIGEESFISDRLCQQNKTEDSSSDEVIIAIKAERILIKNSKDKISSNTTLGIIKRFYYLGKSTNLEVECSKLPRPIKVAIPSSDLSKYKIGDEVTLSIPKQAIECFKDTWDKIKLLEEP